MLLHPVKSEKNKYQNDFPLIFILFYNQMKLKNLTKLEKLKIRQNYLIGKNYLKKTKLFFEQNYYGSRLKMK